MEDWSFEDLAYAPDPSDEEDCIQVTLIKQAELDRRTEEPIDWFEESIDKWY
jgi:hypothetical protein